MGRQKPNFRAMLLYLTNDEKLHKVLTVKEVMQYLDKSRHFVNDRIKHGDLRTDKSGNIPIGALASYLLGNIT